MPRVVHFEIPVDDSERARAFYRTLFDWKLDGWGDVRYWLTAPGEPTDEPGADGALIDRSELHAAPVVVIGVEDLDDMLNRAKDAGAEVVQGRLSVPGMGYSAYLRDTEGNVIGLFQGDDAAS